VSNKATTVDKNKLFTFILSPLNMPITVTVSDQFLSININHCQLLSPCSTPWPLSSFLFIIHRANKAESCALHYCIIYSKILFIQHKCVIGCADRSILPIDRTLT